MMYDNLREHREQHFYCPNGHNLHFNASKVEQQQREINALTERLRYSFDEISRQRGVIKALNQSMEKKRRRINAGVCPHCQRSFVTLARHIRTKHPTEPLPNNEIKSTVNRSLPTEGAPSPGGR